MSLSRQLPRRYLELAREASYALGAKVTLHQAGRLTLPSFRSTETRIVVTNDGGSAGHPGAKLLRSKFAAEQIRAHQRISKQLLIVTQVAEKVLHGNLTSRLRICSRHVVSLLIRHSMKANWGPNRTVRADLVDAANNSF
jgi:hypothetical protein